MAAFETALLWVLGGVVLALIVTTTLGGKKNRKTARQIAREREDLQNDRSKYDNGQQRPLA